MRLYLPLTRREKNINHVRFGTNGRNPGPKNGTNEQEALRFELLDLMRGMAVVAFLLVADFAGPPRSLPTWRQGRGRPWPWTGTRWGRRNRSAHGEGGRRSGRLWEKISGSGHNCDNRRLKRARSDLKEIKKPFKLNFGLRSPKGRHLSINVCLPSFTEVRRVCLTKKETHVTEARLHLPSHMQGVHLPHASTSLFTRSEMSVFGPITDLGHGFAFFT
jgi:hypothetical protein